MNSLPWYRSPVYVGILVNIIVGLVNLLNLQDVVTVEIITDAVAAIVTVIGIVTAAIAEWKRRRSALQPITLRRKEEQ